jgi:hypothetical protein
MASTHLITITFFTTETEEIIELIQDLRSLWETKAIESMLFQDVGEPGKLMLLLLTSEPIDEITRMIKEDPATRDLFTKIRDTKSRLVISCMDRVA